MKLNKEMGPWVAPICVLVAIGIVVFALMIPPQKYTQPYAEPLPDLDQVMRASLKQLVFTEPTNAAVIFLTPENMHLGGDGGISFDPPDK